MNLFRRSGCTWQEAGKPEKKLLYSYENYVFGKRKEKEICRKFVISTFENKSEGIVNILSF